MRVQKGVSETVLRRMNQLIGECSDRGELKLPSLRTIARTIGYSLPTVEKAVRELAARGLVTGFRSKGVFIGRHATPPSGPGPASQEAEQKSGKRGSVCEQLTADFSSGVFSMGTSLPTTKELCLRYGASYRAVKSALEDLADRQIIERRGRGYRAAAPVRVARSACIVLCDYGSETGRIHTSAERTRLTYAIELECLRHEISLLRVAFTSQEAEEGFAATCRARHEIATIQRPVVGFVLGAKPFCRSVPNLLKLVAGTNAPIAVYNDALDVDISELRHERRPVAVYSFRLQRDAGFRVGAYLCSLGHRRVVYISPLHQSPWSQMRLDGLREAVGIYASSGSVDAVVSEEHRQVYDFYWKSPWFQAKDEFIAKMSTLQGDMPQSYATFLSGVDASFGSTMAVAEFRWHVTDLFEKALNPKGATAWVCANDLTAMAAQDFLRKEGIDIPGTISVVGFDNLPETVAQALTTFDFREEDVARSMMEFVLSSHRPRDHTMPRITGRIIERESVGCVGNP